MCNNACNIQRKGLYLTSFLQKLVHTINVPVDKNHLVDSYLLTIECIFSGVVYELGPSGNSLRLMYYDNFWNRVCKL